MQLLLAFRDSRFFAFSGKSKSSIEHKENDIYFLIKEHQENDES